MWHTNNWDGFWLLCRIAYDWICNKKFFQPFLSSFFAFFKSCWTKKCFLQKQAKNPQSGCHTSPINFLARLCDQFNNLECLRKRRRAQGVPKDIQNCLYRVRHKDPVVKDNKVLRVLMWTITKIHQCISLHWHSFATTRHPFYSLSQMHNCCFWNSTRK